MNPINKTRLIAFIATAGGFGLLPLMPGTWGTLAGVFIHGLGRFLFKSALGERLFIGITVLLIFVLSSIVLPECRRLWGEKDPKRFVLDEVVGYLVVPLFLGRRYPFWVIATGGFLLFRIFDILKPPGARQFNSRDDFIGVMGDDVISGLYAVIFLRIFVGIGYNFNLWNF